eukprot:GFUD01016896.1.p1 GENE.GFUD01016896.1~~GFUD01016896.1.p1  ORF type:complete len:805 (+),score=264.23 GFUD01016896.1:106-2520(+)
MCPNKKQKKVSKTKAAPDVEALPATNLSRTCCVPQGQVSCPSLDILDQSTAIRVLCSNLTCPQSGLMHQKCFDKFESLAMLSLSKQARCRDWSHKQRLSCLWINRGYDLIYKMCACECGHGHIRRDLDCAEAGQDGVEGAAALQPLQEKKKKKKSEAKKPKLNYPKDKVSEKSVGSFSYNKQCKSTSFKNTLRPCIDDDDTACDDFLLSVPGLTTLKSHIKDPTAPNSKSVSRKVKELSNALVNPVNEEDGWTIVSKGSVRRENRHTYFHDLASSDEPGIEDVKLDNTAVPDEVYLSDDEGCDNGQVEEGWSASDHSLSGETNSGFNMDLSVASLGAEDVKIKVEDGGNKLEKLSNKQLQEILGELQEEILLEETSKKKALEKVKSLHEQNQAMGHAFLLERNKFQVDIDFLQQSNMELREVAEAREVGLHQQLDDLQTAFTAEVEAKNKLLQQNFHLRGLIQGAHIDHARSVAEADNERTKLKEQEVEAAEMVKENDREAFQVLENEKMKILVSVDAMEVKIKSLVNTVEYFKGEMEKISANNLLTEENLVSEKKLVKNLKDQLEAKEIANKNSLKTILEAVLIVLKSSTSNGLSSTIFHQVLKKVDALNELEATDYTNLVSQLYQNKPDQCEVAPQSDLCSRQIVVSTTDKQVTSRECALLMERMETDRQEAQQTCDRVDMLEASVKTLQWKNKVMESNMTRREEVVMADSGEKNLSGIKEKIVDLVKECSHFEKMSRKMVCDQNVTEQQIDELSCGGEQQISDNEKFRVDLIKMKKKMEAFEEEINVERNKKQSWTACKWL